MYIIRIYIDTYYIHVIYVLYTYYIRVICEPDVDEMRSKQEQKNKRFCLLFPTQFANGAGKNFPTNRNVPYSRFFIY